MLHQILKDRILLENYFLPGDLKAHVAAFVGHYNHQCYHESLKKPHPDRRTYRTRPNHPARAGKDKTADGEITTLAVRQTRRITET